MATRERRSLNRTGICISETCDKAKSKEVQTIRGGKEFVCEACSKELRETKPPKKVKLLPIILGVTGVVIVGLGVGSYVMEIPESLYSKAAVETVVEGPVVEGPVVEPVEKEPEEVKPIVYPTQGTINLAYGSYTGKLKNGKASGYGTMTYSKRTLISQYDRKQRYAEAGQYIVGTWYDNKLDNGTLYNSDGTPVEVLQIGRAE